MEFSDPQVEPLTISFFPVKLKKVIGNWSRLSKVDLLSFLHLLNLISLQFITKKNVLTQFQGGRINREEEAEKRWRNNFWNRLETVQKV